MKLALYIILCFFLVFPVFAEDTDSSAIFRADFYKHEMQQYDIFLNTYRLASGDTVALEKVMMKADVYVADSSESQYIITWKFHDFSINTNSMQLQNLVGLAKPVSLTYRTSRPGVLNEFTDWEEISMSLADGMKEVLALYASRKDTTAEMEVKRIFAFRESFESLMLRSVRLFHQAYGLGYKLNEEVDVPSEIIGTVSPVPVNGIIRKKLTNIDLANHVAVLSTATIPDRTELEKTLSESYGGSVPEYMLNPIITGALVSDLDTGWVLYTFEQHEVGPDKQKSGEMLEIQHIENTYR